MLATAMLAVCRRLRPVGPGRIARLAGRAPAALPAVDRPERRRLLRTSCSAADSAAGARAQRRTACFFILWRRASAVGVPLLWRLSRARPIDPLPVAPARRARRRRARGLPAAILPSRSRVTVIDLAVHLLAVLIVVARGRPAAAPRAPARHEPRDEARSRPAGSLLLLVIVAGDRRLLPVRPRRLAHPRHAEGAARRARARCSTQRPLPLIGRLLPPLCRRRRALAFPGAAVMTLAARRDLRPGARACSSSPSPRRSAPASPSCRLALSVPRLGQGDGSAGSSRRSTAASSATASSICFPPAESRSSPSSWSTWRWG